jgi:uncharacterized protein (TIGR02646 family)
MIFVKRRRVPKSLNPKDAESAGAKERAAFIKRWDEEKALPKAEDYKAYTADDVRKALTEQFHGKCAFCESGISGSSQTDIEHFRPKGAVKEAEDAGVEHPGYWWLAMAWENLLLSCMHCNQHRRQLIFTPGMTREEILKAIENNDLQTTGKKNAFPTVGNAWVTSYKKNVKDEKPLLINPTVVNPATKLDWEFDGELSTVKPRSGSISGERTIAVLGLNRRYLTEDRMKILSIMRLQADGIRQIVDLMTNAPTVQAAEAYRVSAVAMLRGLGEFAREEKNFAGMARAFFDQVSKVVASAL